MELIIRAKRVSNCYIPPPKICACVRLILVLVWGTYYVPDTYVPHFMIPGTYYVPNTYDTRYVLCTRYVCTTLAVVLLIVQLYCYLFFVSGWWYAWYLRSAQETAVSLFVYSLVGGGITQTFRLWTHTSDDSYIYQLALVVATATVSFIFRMRGDGSRPILVRIFEVLFCEVPDTARINSSFSDPGTHNLKKTSTW